MNQEDDGGCKDYSPTGAGYGPTAFRNIREGYRVASTKGLIHKD